MSPRLRFLPPGMPVAFVASFIAAFVAVFFGGAFARASAAPGATAPADREIRMTVAGDSLALGIGASDSARGFAFDLFERVRAEHAASEVTNLAIGGATARDVLRLEVPRIDASHPTVILVEIGANDLVRRRSAGAFASDYRALVEAIRRASPRATIVLFNVPDIAVSPIFERSIKPALHRLALAYNVTVAREARRIGAPVVDLFDFSKRADSDPGRYFSADQFHPSDEGHAAIAASAWPTVRRAISR